MGDAGRHDAMPANSRREFLSRSGVWAALAAAPTWLLDSLLLRDEEQDPQEQDSKKVKKKRKTLQDRFEEAMAAKEERALKARRPHIERAIARAKNEGKPLLLLVLPERDAKDPYVGGVDVFSALFNRSTTVERCELAMFVPVCARISEVRAINQLGKVEGRPSLLLVDVAAAEPRFTPVYVESEPSPEVSFEITKEERQAQIDWVTQAVRNTTAALRKATGEHAPIEAMAAAANLTDVERRKVDGWLAGNKYPGAELLLRAAAVVMHRTASMDAKTRDGLRTKLAVDYDAHVVSKRIAGSRWWHDDPCGARPERKLPGDGDGPFIQCGMASLPPVTARFLKFYL